jgi:hypothetical protein
VRRVCLTASFAFALLAVHAATYSTGEIPFEYREGLLWIKATVRQPSTTLNLLLDTGAGVSVLNTSAAERIGLQLGSPMLVRGVATSVTGYSLRPVSLSSKGFQLPAPSIAVDLQTLSSSCEQAVDGLVGADFFRGRIVEIDFEAHKIRILLPQAESKFDDSLPLQVRRCGIRVPVSVNGRKAQWARLDTGCASDLQWVTSKVRAEDCGHKSAIGLTEVSIPQTQTTVEIGSHQFHKVPTGIHEKSIFQGEAGLLGTGLLSRFSSIAIDGQAGRLLLQGGAADL